jgi:hypothetical protein
MMVDARMVTMQLSCSQILVIYEQHINRRGPIVFAVSPAIVRLEKNLRLPNSINSRPRLIKAL